MNGIVQAIAIGVMVGVGVYNAMRNLSGKHDLHFASAMCWFAWALYWFCEAWKGI